jgi:phosphate butyryltransferase
MILRNFDELIGVAKVRGKRHVAVARADDETVLSGLKHAWEEDLVEPLLFGDKTRIHELKESLGIEADWEIVHTDDDDETCSIAAVKAVKEGRAHLLMKGQVSTATLFKAVLNRQHGLQRSGILSHVAMMEIPHYHKLFAVSDGGLNLNPTLEQKVEILRNTVAAFHCLGYVRPKVGLLSYVEKINEGDPETTEWGKIVEMASSGDFGDVEVAGPLAMDLCLSKKAKEIKGYKGQVAANVDIIIAPNITAGNASCKALLLEGGTAGGIVTGAAAPIIALSRADSPRARLCSVALGSALLNQ